MKTFYRERGHRLPVEYYEGNKTIAFTLCTRNRAPLFCRVDVVQHLTSLLETSAIAYECELLVYLFMPDHLHLLMHGVNDRSNCYQAVMRFKHRSGFFFYQRKVEGRWQKDFYDHILRKEEDVYRHVRYILENPVRAGLLDNWQAYPFKGSMIWDLDTWDKHW